MKLNPIARNMTEVRFGDNTMLFSYKTPVAVCIRGEGWYRTEKKWSVTTSRHINKWLAGINATERPQSFFDGLTG